MTSGRKPRLTLVAAVAAERVIGIDNRLPWSLPEDMKHFRAVTIGKPVIMGRKTWEAIGRPLTGRRNIVLTRKPDWCSDGAEVVHSLEEALVLAGAVEEVCLIGGDELYRKAIISADCLRLTEIDASYPGDAHFPDVSPEHWREYRREVHVSAEGVRYAFVDYLRR